VGASPRLVGSVAHALGANYLLAQSCKQAAKKMPPHVTCSGIHKPQVTGITVPYYIDNGSGGESLNPPEPCKDNLFTKKSFASR
jgi:hypothetical protein